MSIAEIRAPSAATVGDYVSLLKPRVMSLVIFTAAVGLLVAPGVLDPVLAIASLLAIAAGAGGSAALNMAYDSDIDALMARTANRAIPSGRIARGDAAALGIALSLFSVLALALAAGYLAAALLAFTIFFYAVVYTVGLKRRTPQNIVLGGAAGALPPVIGWAAATGNAPLAAWALFLIIFLWTPRAFLGARAFEDRRFRARPPSHAAERDGRPGDAAPYPRLCRADRRGVRLAGLARHGGRALCRRCAGDGACLPARRLARRARERGRSRAARPRDVRDLDPLSLPRFAALLADRLLGLAPLMGAP